MSLIVDPKLPEPLTIGARTYMLKPATVAERMRWRRAIAAAGGRQHGPLGTLTCLSAGIRSLYEGQGQDAVRDALLQKIHDQRSRVVLFFECARGAVVGSPEANQAFLAANDAMNEGDASLATIVAEVAANYSAYAQMVADEAMYWPISGLEAARMFLVGWKGFEAALAIGPAGVSDDSLAEIPEGDLRAIGQFYESLTQVTPQQRKNLASLPLTSSGGEISSTLRKPPSKRRSRARETASTSVQ